MITYLDLDIERNLKMLNIHYQRGNVMGKSFASKLAILELCGWIEESMDECIKSAGNRILRQDKFYARFEKKLRRKSGFDFERNFIPMIIDLIGICGLERVSKDIDPAVAFQFKSELNSLRVMRNALAHTHTKDFTVNYDAPSVTIERLAKVKAGFSAYDSALRGFRP